MVNTSRITSARKSRASEETEVLSPNVEQISEGHSYTEQGPEEEICRYCQRAERKESRQLTIVEEHNNKHLEIVD